jgi:hypothetical protein
VEGPVQTKKLWSYLQGLTLTASNKRWLADHLYESAKTEERAMTREERLAECARIRKEKEKVLWANMPKVSKEDLIPSQEILDIVKDVEPMPDDVDTEKLKYDYLMKKYG